MGKPVIEGREVRNFIASELRAEPGSDGKKKIVGYAAVFEELSEDLYGFREKIRVGAFSKTITEADVRALWNHNRDYVLGRTKSGTLRLQEDAHGLKIEIDPPDTQWARDLMVSIERGDVTQMSFGFETVRDEWEDIGHDEWIRTLVEVRLFDVSPVTFPAYLGTVVDLRGALEKAGVENVEEFRSAVTRVLSGNMQPADKSLIERALETLEKIGDPASTVEVSAPVSTETNAAPDLEVHPDMRLVEEELRRVQVLRIR